MKLITNESEFQEEIGKDQLSIVLFKADWCKDCHYIDPFMPDVVEQYSDRIQFSQVDRDQLPDLCAEHNILGIPSFIAYSGGQELIRFVSKLRKTREEIEQFLDRAIAVAAATSSTEG